MSLPVERLNANRLERHTLEPILAPRGGDLLTMFTYYVALLKNSKQSYIIGAKKSTRKDEESNRGMPKSTWGGAEKLTFQN